MVSNGVSGPMQPLRVSVSTVSMTHWLGASGSAHHSMGGRDGSKDTPKEAYYPLKCVRIVKHANY